MIASPPATAHSLSEDTEATMKIQSEDYETLGKFYLGCNYDLDEKSGASRAWKESGDVSRVEKKVERLEDQLAELEAEAGREITNLKEAMEPINEKLEKNCSAKSVGIVWLPRSR